MNRRGQLLFNFSLSAGKIVEEGLMVDILLRLPVKSLIRFKCVCKSWRSLISDPCFERAHLSRSTLVNPNSQRLLLAFEGPHSDLKLLYSEINSEAAIEDENDLLDCSVKFKLPMPFVTCKIIGSCHGLVCLDVYHILVVWNPTTGAFKKIPHPTKNLKLCAIGFGYDSTIDDYKLLAYDFGGRQGYELFIFTMKENYWRNVCVSMGQDEKPPFNLGCYANGFLHWLQYELFLHVKNPVEPSILSFDLSNEKFERIALPADIDPKCSYELGEFQGCLLFYARDARKYDHDNRCQKCWIMEEHDSWTKVSGDSETTVCCTTDAKALLWLFCDDDDTPDIYRLYSPKKNKFTPFAPLMNHMLHSAGLYVESLVSP